MVVGQLLLQHPQEWLLCTCRDSMHSFTGILDGRYRMEELEERILSDASQHCRIEEEDEGN